MFQWFSDLNTLQQIYTLVAVPATLILVLQTLLLILGFGFDGDAELDIDGDGVPDAGLDGDGGLTLFSSKTIVAFLCIGGWSGVAFAGMDMSHYAAISLSLLCGFAALVIMALMIKGMLSLQEAGNIEISNAIGKVGQVYIPIPAKAKGSGKITIVLQGKFSELDAITDDSTPIKTGEPVRVVSTDETGLLVVERVKRD